MSRFGGDCDWVDFIMQDQTSLVLTREEVSILFKEPNSGMDPVTGLRLIIFLTRFGVKALDKYNVEKDIAAYIKKEFDKNYNPTWHCIVGRNFGMYLRFRISCRVPVGELF